MDSVRCGLLGGLVVLGAGAVWLAWMNRADQQLVERAITGGLVGALASIVTILMSMRPSVSEEEFPVVLLIQESERAPLQADGRSISLPVLPPTQNDSVWFFQALKANPDFAAARPEDYGLAAAQYLVLSTIAELHLQGWHFEVKRIQTPNISSRSISHKAALSTNSVHISWNEFVRGSAYSAVFSNVNGRLVTQLGLKLPPETKMEILEEGFNRTLRLENSFVRVSASVRFDSMERGPGIYGMLTGEGLRRVSATNDVLSLTCVVGVVTEHKRWRSGHPQMQQYADWARNTSSFLREQLDHDRHLAKAKENFLLNQAAKPVAATKPK